MQILCAIVLGALFGWIAPVWAQQLRPVGEVFMGAVRLLVGPVIFFTVASGIGAMRDLRQLRLAGFGAFLYFETVALLALAFGMFGAWLLAPGAGMVLHAGPGILSSGPLSSSFFIALLSNATLHMLLAGVLFGIGLAYVGERGRPLALLAERGTLYLGKLVNLVLLLAPLATFCAIAVTVSGIGLAALAPLLKLLGTLYLSSFLFIVIVLGTIAWWSGYSLWRFVLFTREEMMIVIGTSSSIAALPRLIGKLEQLGCAPPLVRAMVSAGFCVNLNGSNIYLMAALLFLAQAANIDLSAGQYLFVLAVAMITSKGACGVVGSSFLALGATIAVLPGIPDSGLLLVFAIERLLKCRSLTNFLGNGVACLAMCAWMRRLDRKSLRSELGRVGAPVFHT